MTKTAKHSAIDLETAAEILSLFDIDCAADPKQYAIQREEMADYLAAARADGFRLGREQERARVEAALERLGATKHKP